jgi:hypothetical protein
MKAIKILALASLFASMIISGCDCGDGDGGMDADIVVPDGGIRADGGDAAVDPPDGGDAGEDPPDGGGDGGLTFSAFVKDLILNQTNETATPVELPSPDLPDNEDPTAYDDLP